MKKKATKKRTRNLVAAHARTFNRSSVQTDRKKDQKLGKHKHKTEEIPND